MSDSTVQTDVSPGRDTDMPDSDTVCVTDDHVHVWQYRVTISEPDDEWYFVETLDCE
jgi:hypothetical protein